jgi:hypothetical protein
MTTQHPNICTNNCIYATKAVFLSRAGTSEDWLYRCLKLEERIITTDSVIHELGCATFTTGRPSENQDDLVKRAQDMLTEINLKIEEDKKKAESKAAPVVMEPVKPVEKVTEPVVVPAPTAAIPPQRPSTDRLTVPATILPLEPAVQSTPTPPVTVTEEPVKKKRGRKPKQAVAEPSPAVPIATPVKEVIKDGGLIEGNKPESHLGTT